MKIKQNTFFFGRDNNLHKLSITYDNNGIKQYGMIEYLYCFLDTNLSGVCMTIKCLRKINTKLQLLYRQ